MTAFGMLVAPLDARLSDVDRAVLSTVVSRRIATLDELCRRCPNLPRPYVFAAVARLEDLGYLPTGAIR
jgi:hypothetical protein